MAPHEVAVLALHDVLPMDLAIPVQVFGPWEQTSYRLRVCAPEPRVRTSGGFSLLVDGDLADARRADTLVVPGYRAYDAEVDEVVADLVAGMRARGRRVVSICTGAFVLARAGVLDGLRATTHWRATDLLAARHPAVEVVGDVLYVDEGDVLTSAGISAGLDLCLHVVGRDFGAVAANAVARALVAAPHRDGGQAQFIDARVGAGPDGSLAATRAWALQHLTEPLGLSELARHAGVSQRTLSRRFAAEAGCTPVQWVLRARIDHARELLETRDIGIDEVAVRCGMGTAVNLRRHFRRILGTTPTAYRRTFSRTVADVPGRRS
jgi:transcriptional regulator GlxA family with amidase domain